jgi:polyisoprenoid-binding protein YceI
MKSFLALCLTFSTAIAFAQDKPMLDTYKVDAAATKVVWEGKKVLGKHNGTISVKSGSLTLTGEVITAGEIVVDMKTIVNTDIPTDTKENKETNAKLVGHLSSPDFFNVEKYPESKLVIKTSEKTKTGLKVTGDLTMIGKTKPITFDAVVTKGADLKVKTTLVIDRTLWDLKYGSGSFFKGLGDKAINNEFTLAIELTAKK